MAKFIKHTVETNGDDLLHYEENPTDPEVVAKCKELGIELVGKTRRMVSGAVIFSPKASNVPPIVQQARPSTVRISKIEKDQRPGS
jgi:hypothetical protein